MAMSNLVSPLGFWVEKGEKVSFSVAIVLFDMIIHSNSTAMTF